MFSRFLSAHAAKCVGAFALLVFFSQAVYSATCTYSVVDKWDSGFNARIRIANNRGIAINGWSVKWQYQNNRISHLWNANQSGGNPYSASNLSWNARIEPGQAVEFGFQGTTNGNVAEVPLVFGDVCDTVAPQNQNEQPTNQDTGTTIPPDCDDNDLQVTYTGSAIFQKRANTHVLYSDKFELDLLFNNKIDKNALEKAITLSGEVKNALPGTPYAACTVDNDDLPFVLQEMGVIAQLAPSIHDLGDVQGVRYPQDFAILAFGDVSGLPDVHGPIAAKGKVTLQNFNVNSKQVFKVGIVAGGDVTLKSGSIYGNILYNGALSKTWVGHSPWPGKSVKGPVMDFDPLQQKFIRYSALLGELASTGETQVDAYGGVRFSGSERGSNIFSVSAAQLQAASNIELFIPSDAFAVINVKGNPLSMGNFSFNAHGTPAKHILWNFSEAMSIQIQSLGLSGTLLAPQAGVSFTSGSLNGQLIAASLSAGSAGFSHSGFAGWQALPLNRGVHIRGTRKLHDQCHYILTIHEKPLNKTGQCLDGDWIVEFEVEDREGKSAAEVELADIQISPTDNRIFAFTIKEEYSIAPEDLFQRYSDILKLRRGVDTFESKNATGTSFAPVQENIFFQQFYKGLEVIGRGYQLDLEQAGKVKSVFGNPEIGITLSPVPTIDENQARNVVKSKLNDWNVALTSLGLAVYVPAPSEKDKPHLVWQFKTPKGVVFGVDAHSSDIVFESVTELFAAFLGIEFIKLEDYSNGGTSIVPSETIYGTRNIEVTTLKDGDIKFNALMTDGGSEFSPLPFQASLIARSLMTGTDISTVYNDLNWADDKTLVDAVPYFDVRTLYWAAGQCLGYYEDFGWAGSDNKGFVPALNLTPILPETIQSASYRGDLKAIVIPYSSLSNRVDPEILSSYDFDTYCHEFFHSIDDLNRPGFGDRNFEELSISEGLAQLFAILSKLKVLGDIDNKWAQGSFMYAFLKKITGYEIYWMDIENAESNSEYSTLYNSDAWNAITDPHYTGVVIDYWGYLLTDADASKRTRVSPNGCSRYIEPLNSDSSTARSMLHKITFDAYINRLKNVDATFPLLAEATINSAKALYRRQPTLADKIKNAWASVGVYTAPNYLPAPGSSNVDPWSAGISWKIEETDFGPWTVEIGKSRGTWDRSIKVTETEQRSDGRWAVIHDLQLEPDQKYYWQVNSGCGEFIGEFSTGGDAIELIAPETQFLEDKNFYVFGNLGAWEAPCDPFVCEPGHGESDEVEAVSAQWKEVKGADGYFVDVNLEANCTLLPPSPTREEILASEAENGVFSFVPEAADPAQINYLHIQPYATRENGEPQYGTCSTFPFYYVESFKLYPTAVYSDEQDFMWEQLPNAEGYELRIYEVDRKGNIIGGKTIPIAHDQPPPYIPAPEEELTAGHYYWEVVAHLPGGISVTSAAQDLTVIPRLEPVQEQPLVLDTTATSWDFYWKKSNQSKTLLSLIARRISGVGEEKILLDRESYTIQERDGNHYVSLATQPLLDQFEAYPGLYNFRLVVTRVFDLPKVKGKRFDRYVEEEDEIKFNVTSETLSLEAPELQEYKKADADTEAEYFVVSPGNSKTFNVKWKGRGAYYSVYIRKIDPDSGKETLVSKFENIAHVGDMKDLQTLMDDSGKKPRNVSLPPGETQLYRLTVRSQQADNPTSGYTDKSVLIRPDHNFVWADFFKERAASTLLMKTKAAWVSDTIPWYRLRVEDTVSGKQVFDSGPIKDDPERRGQEETVELQKYGHPYKFSVDLLASKDLESVLLTKSIEGKTRARVEIVSTSEQRHGNKIDLRWEGEGASHYLIRVEAATYTDNGWEYDELDSEIVSHKNTAVQSWAYDDVIPGAIYRVHVHALFANDAASDAGARDSSIFRIQDEAKVEILDPTAKTPKAPSFSAEWTGENADYYLVQLRELREDGSNGNVVYLAQVRHAEGEPSQSGIISGLKYGHAYQMTVFGLKDDVPPDLKTAPSDTTKVYIVPGLTSNNLPENPHTINQTYFDLQLQAEGAARFEILVTDSITGKKTPYEFAADPKTGIGKKRLKNLTPGATILIQEMGVYSVWDTPGAMACCMTLLVEEEEDSDDGGGSCEKPGVPVALAPTNDDGEIPLIGIGGYPTAWDIPIPYIPSTIHGDYLVCSTVDGATSYEYSWHYFLFLDNGGVLSDWYVHDEAIVTPLYLPPSTGAIYEWRCRAVNACGDAGDWSIPAPIRIVED